MGLVERVRAWPAWAKVTALVIAGLLLIGAIADAQDDDGDDARDATVRAASLDDAVAVVQRRLPISTTDDTAGDLILGLCEAARTGRTRAAVRSLAALELRDEDVLRDTLDAVGDGAELHCPDAVAERPELLNDLYRTLAPDLATTTSTSSSSTTVEPATTTTAATQPALAPPPAPPAVPPTQPPATQPPATQPPAGDVYYENCAAARAAGAAPIHAGEPGYRPRLDGDSDGIACE